MNDLPDELSILLMERDNKETVPLSHSTITPTPNIHDTL